MELLTILLCMIVFFVGALYGWHLRERHAERYVHHILKDVVQEQIIPNLVHIEIEKSDNMIYIYNKEDKSFMAQGSTRKEVEENLAKRFPGKIFGADDNNLREVGFK